MSFESKCLFPNCKDIFITSQKKILDRQQVVHAASHPTKYAPYPSGYIVESGTNFEVTCPDGSKYPTTVTITSDGVIRDGEKIE